MNFVTFLKVFLLFACFSCTYTCDEDKLTPQNLLPFTGAVPEALNFVEVNLARHHIIPSEALGSFFRAALYRQSRNPAESQEFEKIITTLAFTARMRVSGNIAVPTGPCRNWPADAFEFVLRMNGKLAFDDSAYSDTSFLQTAFEWMPGNVVAGPDRRSDDPGNNKLDVALLNFIDETDRPLVRAIYSHMRAYIDHRTWEDVIYTVGVGPPITSLRRIASLLTGFMFKYPGMQQYDHTKWDVDISSGEFSVRNP